jgi:hypothetical protein
MERAAHGGPFVEFDSISILPSPENSTAWVKRILGEWNEWVAGKF